MEEVICFKNHMHIFECLIVLRHGGIMQVQLMHVKLVHVHLSEYICDLTAAVGTEVKADSHIAILYSSNRLPACIGNHSWQNKFVGNLFKIGLLYSVYSTIGNFTNSIHQGIVCQFNAVPALVTVHSIVAPAHGSNF